MPPILSGRFSAEEESFVHAYAALSHVCRYIGYIEAVSVSVTHVQTRSGVESVDEDCHRHSSAHKVLELTSCLQNC